MSVRNVTSTEVESLLTVSNVSAKDGGRFTCRAANEAGSAEHGVSVTVQSELGRRHNCVVPAPFKQRSLARCCLK